MPWWYLVLLLTANLTLLLPPAAPARVAGALLLIGLLPGLSWANHFLARLPFLFRWTTAAALSYILASLAVLLFSYLPGPTPTWAIVVSLNMLALLPLLSSKSAKMEEPGVNLSFSRISPLRAFTPLLVILLLALLLRTFNLDYSEFQGDEALAMIAAAEALEGHEDALFLRSKGPGEVLLPMALWRLSGVITEPIARLPFSVASLWAIVAIYLIGQRLGGHRVGWLAAGFFAFNGFMVAFGRIVQYQALVIWLCAMVFLLISEWQATGQRRYLLVGGLCLGLGLLAHYDAVLVVPASVWVLLARPAKTTADRRPPTARFRFAGLPPAAGNLLKPALIFSMAVLLAALPFYLPFSLDPQANRTGDYLGGRIGTELRNNLPDFFHFTTFYSSFYYLLVTGLLVLGLLAWLLGQTRWGRWLASGAIGGVLVVSFSPTWLAWDSLNLSILPFGLLLGGAFGVLLLPKQRLSAPTDESRPSSLPLPSTREHLLPLLLWLAVPFLGYNFVVALGLTHIYTIVPAWSLLAGLGWSCLFDSVPPRPRLISNGLLATLAVLSTLFLWNAFIRHDVEYWQDYPAGNLALYWNPYDRPPPAGFFGLAHRSGWKAVGQKIAAGELVGDYASNEEPDVTTWYTRGAPRACDTQPEFYFLADDLIDPIPVPGEIISVNYAQIGQVTLPNQKQMRIMQLKPASLARDDWHEAGLAREFDQTATPAAFARSTRGLTPVEANFSGLVRLIGYDLDLQRAYPGGRLPVTLYWQAVTPVPSGYQVFTHLEGPAGPVAQADGTPVCWSYPTDHWRPGQIIADQHAIYLAPDTPPGDYPLEVGLYQADTFARLDVLDQAGNATGTSFVLTRVMVRTRE